MTQTKIVASMQYPTPQWFRVFIRTCLWITGLYALVSIQINFTDFGVSIATENLILKYMAVFSTLVSVIGRFIGEKPIDFSRFEANTQHMYAVSKINAWNDPVQAFNGVDYTTVPLPTVDDVVAMEGLTKWVEPDFGGANYYAISSSYPFTIKINGVVHTAQIFTGRPPIIIR